VARFAPAKISGFALLSKMVWCSASLAVLVGIQHKPRFDRHLTLAPFGRQGTETRTMLGSHTGHRAIIRDTQSGTFVEQPRTLRPQARQTLGIGMWPRGFLVNLSGQNAAQVGDAVAGTFIGDGLILGPFFHGETSWSEILYNDSTRNRYQREKDAQHAALSARARPRAGEQVLQAALVRLAPIL